MNKLIGLALLLCSGPVLAQDTLPNVIILSTRTNRLLKNTPIAVQVIGREDIEEGTAQSPANIRELLTELSGTQLQQTSAVSGNVSIRLQGLDGRYTQLLKDGFPLYGGFSGSLSILQVPPLDLHQVEVIKGAGSALYGGDAIAGIINLITRQPDTTLHLDGILNQTQRGETDLGGYFSIRNRHFGWTVMGTASRQTPVDVNNDGFSDLPRIRQGTIAPTFFWYPSNNTTVRFGVDISAEHRTGGDLYAVKHAPDSLHPFRQQNSTDRDYYQLSVTHKAKNDQTLVFKNSICYFYRSIGQSSGTADYHFTGAELSSFTELSYTKGWTADQFVAGIDLISDRFTPTAPNAGLRYSHTTAGGFAQDDWTIAKKLILETGIRADEEHTLYLLPRLALLYKPFHGLSARLGGGLAYKLPTVFNAQDEEEGYLQVRPITPTVNAERSGSLNFSLNYQGRLSDEITFAIDQNFYYTRLENALIPNTDSLQKGWLVYYNAPGPVVTRGSETNARFTLDDLSLYLGYTLTDARQRYLPGDPALPLTPKSKLVTGLTWESEPHWKAGAEAFFTGSQYLDNGRRTQPFQTFDLMIQHSWGPLSILLNVENVTDTRQSRFGPLYTGTMQNPVFNEVYAPLEGRIISLAFRYTR